uniref:F-box domain-containing protein n=1 Tax=Brassica oleracea var. oleracea TaxID=109376 RepID=A0A0D3E087_BRAOL
MASSSMTTRVMKEDGECINWADLPSELTLSILSRLDTIDILENAQKVCTSWHRVCKDPAMWRKIVIPRDIGDLVYDLKYVAMCRHAVDRSQGGLVEIDIWYIGTDSLLNYIADSFPSLEELEVPRCRLMVDFLKVVGQSCPNLKTLKLYCEAFMRPRFVYDDFALAIAETMPGLQFLQLVGDLLSDIGVSAILDNCPNLEHLDLRLCFNIKFAGDLEKQCSERIKVLRRPEDSFHDYPYEISFYDTDASEDYYPEDDYFEVPSDHFDYDPYDIDDGPFLDGGFSYMHL